jgi:salicylate hydroxylase
MTDSYLGIKSKARESIHSTIDHWPRYTGFAVYRATVDVKKIKEDPQIAWILEKSSLNIW